MAAYHDDPDERGQQTLELLYRQHAPDLRRRVAGRLRSSDEANDLVQEAFVRLLGSRPKDQLREPRAFLNRIIRNLLIDRSRRLAHKAVHVPPESENEPAVPPSQADGIELAEMQVRYCEAIAVLPPRTREVFILHRVKELDYVKIAARLSISTRTVEWHMAQAIIRLGKELGRL